MARRLHNMTPPLRWVSIAPHRAEPRGVEITVPSGRALIQDGPWLPLTLCNRFQIDWESNVRPDEVTPWNSETLELARARVALERITDMLVEGLPAAAPVWKGPGRRQGKDSLVALAILSRASERVVLFRRTPVFSSKRLHRKIVVPEEIYKAVERRRRELRPVLAAWKKKRKEG